MTDYQKAILEKEKKASEANAADLERLWTQASADLTGSNRIVGQTITGTEGRTVKLREKGGEKYWLTYKDGKLQDIKIANTEAADQEIKNYLFRGLTPTLK